MPYVFTEGEAQEVQCVVNNVVPVPNVRISIGGVDYTDGFEKTFSEDVCSTFVLKKNKANE